MNRGEQETKFSVKEKIIITTAQRREGGHKAGVYL